MRPLGTREGTTVFETAPFDHSGTSPRGCGVVTEWSNKIKRRALANASAGATTPAPLRTGSGGFD